MLEKYKVPMPNQNLSDEEVREYIAYFKWADTNLRPQGKTQPQPAAPGTAKNPSETYSATPMSEPDKRKSGTQAPASMTDVKPAPGSNASTDKSGPRK